MNIYCLKKILCIGTLKCFIFFASISALSIVKLASFPFINGIYSVHVNYKAYMEKYIGAN